MNIAEVAKQLNMSADTLRYYERIGLIPPVKRSKSGIRIYEDNDIRGIEFVSCMRGAGMPIEVLIEYMTLFQQGSETNEARKNILIEQRDILAARLVELQKIVDRLDYKINTYEQSFLAREEEMLGAKNGN